MIYATDGKVVLGGNNEDWSDTNTKVWFYPSEGENYGWVKFGFAGGFPQGGMNDQGLFWDATGCAYLEMPYSEAYKVKYHGPLMEKVIRECATVEDARLIFEQYYCEDQYCAQYLIGDAGGSSMLVEGDSLIIQHGSYQVAANFYHSHPELGGYPNRRYETAVTILESYDELSVNLFGTVLSATHQEGETPTQYSNIYDLKNRVIYLFHSHNFEEFVRIDLETELAGESHSYYLCDLFSSIQIISPLHIRIENPSSVIFQWQGRISSRYDLYYATEPDFSNTHIVMMVESAASHRHATFFASVLGVILIIGLLSREKNVKIFLITTVLSISVMFAGCVDEISAPQNSVDLISRTIEGLQADTTYYWKLIAYPQGNSGFYSETVVQRFRTGPR